MGINVLSLFDGMSCGQIALKKLGITVDNYFACEIDKHAIQVTQHNFPNTIQLGDVTKVSAKDLPRIDLLIGGSPCQGFSFAGKQLAFDDPRSKLFFEFVRLKNECNPTYFMLENVKMKKEFELIISQYLGVAPIEINSALLSAQNRVRLFWTNIANEPYGLFGDMQCMIPQPKDKGILLRDILESDVPEKYYLSDKMLKWLSKHSEKRGTEFKQLDGNQKASCLTTTEAKQNLSNDYICVASRGRESSVLTPKRTEYGKAIRKDYEAGKITEQRKNIQQLEPRTDGKTNTLTSVQKDNLVMQLNPSTESGGVQPYQQNRVYDIDGISPGLMAQMSCGSHAILVPEATKTGFAEINPGECFDFENPKSETRRGRKMEDKSNCLMAKETDFMHYTKDFRIRRLTPTECERLQTVPEWFDMSIVSDTQRYKMLGNGWTVDVVAHILSFAKF